MPPPGRRRTKLRKILIFAGVAAFALGGAYLLRRPLLERVIATRVEAALAEGLGGTWRVGRIDGGWISDASVADVRLVEPAAGGRLRAFDVDRVEVEYALLDIAGGTRALTSLRVTGLTLNVDLTQPGADASQGESPVPSPGAVLDALPGALTTLAIDGSVHVRLTADESVASHVAVRGDVHAVDVELRDVAAPFGTQAPSWRARIDRPQPGRLVLASSDTCGGVEFRRIALDLAAAPARLEAEAAVAGGSIRVDASGADVRGDVSGLDLARLPPWVARLAGKDLPATGVVGAKLVVGKDGTATLEARGRGVVVLDLPPLDVDAAIDLAHRPVVVTEATVASASARVSLRGAVIDPADPWFVVDATSATFETDDLATSLRTLGALGEGARAFDGEPPVRLRAALSRTARGPVRVTSADGTGDGATVSASGTVTLPERPRDWRDTLLDLTGTVAADLTPANTTRRFGSVFEGRLESTVRLEGKASAPRIGVDATLRGEWGARREIDLVHVRATLADDALDVAELTLTTAGVTLRATGSAVPSTGAVTAASIEADVSDVSRLLPAAPGGAALRGRAHAVANVRRRGGTTRPSDLAQWLEGVEGTFVAAGVGVEVGIEAGGLALRGARVSGSIHGRAVAVELDATTDGASAQAKLAVDLLDGTARDLVASVRIDDASGVVRALTGTEDVHGAGTVEVRAPAISADLAALEGAHVGAVLHDVAVGGSPAVAATLDASVAGGALRFTATARAADATADVRGTVTSPAADRFVVRLEDATARAGDRDLRLVAPAEIRWGDGRAELVAAAFDVAGTTVRLHGSAGETFELDVAADGVDLSRLVAGVSGRADVHARAGGTVADARLAIDAKFTDVSPVGAESKLSGTLHLAAQQGPGGLDVTEATIDASPQVFATGTFKLPWIVGTSGVRRVEGASIEASVTARTETVAAWAQRAGLDDFGAERVEATLRLADGTTLVDVRAPGLTWAPFGRPSLSVAGAVVLHASADATSTTVSLDAAADTGSTALGTLRLATGVDWTDLAGTLTRAADAPLAAELTLDVPDLSARRPRMPRLSPLEGHIRGRATVAGTLRTPTFKGDADVTDFAVGLLDDARAFDQGTGHESFEGREVRIERLDGRLGLGPIHVDGTLSFPSGATPAADVRIRGENMLIVQDAAMRMRTDAEVAVKGPLDALDVSGDVRLRDTLFALSLDAGGGTPAPQGEMVLFSAGDGPLGRAKLDLRVTGAESVRIVGERVRGRASVDLRIRGTAAFPEPEGRIECLDLLVVLPFSRITLESGVVEFPAGRPFAPRVRAVAECRARGYDVTVRVTGDVPDLDIGISSIPALTRDQAFVLMATGASPDDVSRTGTRGMAVNRAETLAASELASQFGQASDPMERSVLDRIWIGSTAPESARSTDSFDAWYELSDDWRLHVERTLDLGYTFGIAWRVRSR